MNIIAEVSPLCSPLNPLYLHYNHLQTVQSCDLYSEISVILNGLDLCSQTQKSYLLLVCLPFTHTQ